MNTTTTNSPLTGYYTTGKPFEDLKVGDKVVAEIESLNRPERTISLRKPEDGLIPVVTDEPFNPAETIKFNGQTYRLLSDASEAVKAGDRWFIAEGGKGDPKYHGHSVSVAGRPVGKIRGDWHKECGWFIYRPVGFTPPATYEHEGQTYNLLTDTSEVIREDDLRVYFWEDGVNPIAGKASYFEGRTVGENQGDALGGDYRFFYRLAKDHPKATPVVRIGDQFFRVRGEDEQVQEGDWWYHKDHPEHSFGLYWGMGQPVRDVRRSSDRRKGWFIYAPINLYKEISEGGVIYKPIPEGSNGAYGDKVVFLNADTGEVTIRSTPWFETIFECASGSRVGAAYVFFYRKEQPKVARGQRYENDGETFIVASVDHSLYCLINVFDGQRWDDPETLADLSKTIQEDGFKLIL